MAMARAQKDITSLKTDGDYRLPSLENLKNCNHILEMPSLIRPARTICNKKIEYLTTGSMDDCKDCHMVKIVDHNPDPEAVECSRCLKDCRRNIERPCCDKRCDDCLKSGMAYGQNEELPQTPPVVSDRDRQRLAEEIEALGERHYNMLKNRYPQAGHSSPQERTIISSSRNVNDEDPFVHRDLAPRHGRMSEGPSTNRPYYGRQEPNHGHHHSHHHSHNYNRSGRPMSSRPYRDYDRYDSYDNYDDYGDYGDYDDYNRYGGYERYDSYGPSRAPPFRHSHNHRSGPRYERHDHRDYNMPPPTRRELESDNTQSQYNRRRLRPSDGSRELDGLEGSRRSSRDPGSSMVPLASNSSGGPSGVREPVTGGGAEAEKSLVKRDDQLSVGLRNLNLDKE